MKPNNRIINLGNVIIKSGNKKTLNTIKKMIDSKNEVLKHIRDGKDLSDLKQKGHRFVNPL